MIRVLEQTAPNFLGIQADSLTVMSIILIINLVHEKCQSEGKIIIYGIRYHFRFLFMFRMAGNPSSRVLLMEFNKLTKEPVEGFNISLKNEDIYSWSVAIFGPPKTLYEGGYFKAEMTFPHDYPYRFILKKC